MNFQEYQKGAFRTLAVLKNKFTDDLHMVLGIVTEAGELADAYKKYLAYGKELDYVNVQEELGDLMWYIANFCTLNNFDFEKILEINQKKLKARYPEKFTQENAENRNLIRERQILDELYAEHKNPAE
jgi:NTP pyrophosphatase (non-canonical NTP hydrolase)